MVRDVESELTLLDGNRFNYQAGAPMPHVFNQVPHHVHLFGETFVDVFKSTGYELLIIRFEGEGRESHDAVTVVSARSAVGIEPLVSVLYGDVRNAGVDRVANGPEQFPIGRLFGPLPPRVEDDPHPGVHSDIEVGIRDVGVDVSGVCFGFCLAEGCATGLRCGTGVPVVIVIPIQVHLIDVPARVDVVAVRIEHDQDMNLGVLERTNSLFVAIVPAVDVPLCGQPSQRRS